MVFPSIKIAPVAGVSVEVTWPPRHSCPHRTLAFKEGAPRVLPRAQRAAYWSPIPLPAGSVLASYLHPEGLP